MLGTTAFAATAGLAAANGGFFPSTWGWSAVALSWLALIALVVKPLERLRPIEIAFGGATLALAGWTWLSVVWSPVRSESVLEGERALVLVAAVAAVFSVAGRRPVRPLLAGVLAGVVAVSGYALLTRLAPDRMGGYDPLAAYRLSTPVGYWNGLGILAAMGVLLALGIVARGPRAVERVAAGVSLIALVPTLYFTFSRGAWLALAAGLCVALALDPRRLRAAAVLIVCATAPASSVMIASRSSALTHRQTDLLGAAHDGHRLGLTLAALAVVQALAVLALGAVQARARVGRLVRAAFGAVLVLVVVAMLGAFFVRGGGPVAMARDAYRSFTASPPAQATDLNARLFNLSGNGRWLLWQAAWHEGKAHSVLGEGAGAFEQYWLTHRPSTLQVKDAHNLYLETFGELGLLGLALLAVLLAVPFVAAFKARRHPLVPAAAGAFAAYCVHAGADWDWELAGVTLAAFLTGAACVLALREQDDRRPARATRGLRRTAFALLGAVSAVAFVGLIGNEAAARSQAAAAKGNWVSAVSYAHQAVRWAPWSSIGWKDLAVAQLGRGQLGPARASLHRALAKEPRDWSLWLDLGAASRGSTRSAALARARVLNPRSPDLAQIQQEFAGS